jgi:mannosyltransferase
MPSRPREQRWFWLALLVLLLAFALRAFRLDFQSLWRDEVDAVRFATRPFGDLLGTFRRPGENGPLYFLLLRGWLALLGRSEYALRYLSLLGAVGGVALTMAFGKRLISPSAGLLAGLLVATSPYMIWYGQEGKMYGLLVSVVLGALWVFWEAMTRGGWLRWALCWLLTTLAIYLHLMAVLLVPAEVAWFVVMGTASSRARRQVVPMLAMLAMLTLPYLPLIRWQIRLWQNTAFQTGHAFVPLGTMLTSVLWGLSRGVLGSASLWSLIPFVFLLLAALLLPSLARVAGRPEDQDSASESQERPPQIADDSRPGWASGSLQPHVALRRGLLAIWLLLPPLVLFLISLRKPLFTDRYLIWIGPSLYLLLAMGLISVGQRWRALGGALLAALLILNGVAIWRQAHTAIKSDFRSAATYVEGRRTADEALMFLMPYIRHTYAYYAGDVAPWVDPPYTNAGALSSDVEEDLSRLTDGYAGVWLVQSEAATWDSRGIASAWLDRHADRTEEMQFAQVAVAHYRFRRP